MEQQVREMEPILAKKAEEGHALVAKLKVEQKAADQVKYAVMKDEAEAKVLLALVSKLRYNKVLFRFGCISVFYMFDVTAIFL